MPSNEAQVVTAMVKAVKKEWPDTWVFKVVGSPYQMAGVPDLLMCVEGLLVGVEAKHQKPHESEEAARDRATLQQRAQIQRINRAGGIAAVCLTPEEVVDLIRRGLKHKREKATWNPSRGKGQRG